MNTLTTFLPLDRRQALAHNQPLPDRVTGAALFADISGFTPLTAVLTQELGPQRGAEELAHQLDRIFNGLITEVHRYGGSVITFSGDAITCWFDASLIPNSSSESGQHPAALALACALAMQQIMSNLAQATTANGTPLPLALKVAIAAGPARRFLVGDAARQHIEVLAGSTLDHMAAAESVAAKGEIVITSAVLAALKPTPSIQEERTAANGERILVIGRATPVTTAPMQVTAPIIPAALAKSWLLPPIAARLESGHGDFLAELRSAVALFIKFSGIDYDQDDDAGEKLDAFVRRSQAILQRYDGYLLQITMGDKGSYLYITFGAPIAHEDNASRAAHAALALHDLAAGLDFLQPLQMGIHQGQAFSGAYGSATRRTYGVIGNHVNISARLMTTALPGQTLVSAAIAAVLNNQFVLLSLPPVMLKGIRDPFAVWALQGRQAAAPTLFGQTNAPMIGRETELAAIQTLLEKVANGRSANLLIEGAAGIGKSRLVQEVVAQVDTTAVSLFMGSGNAIEQNTLYRAWQPIFEKIFNLSAYTDEMKTDTAWQTPIIDQINPDSRHLAPLLNSVLPLDLPDTPLTAQMTGELRQEKTLQLLVDVLKTAASTGSATVASTGSTADVSTSSASTGSATDVSTGSTAVAAKSLILIIEDGHWLDSASWALIRRIQNQIQPLLLVIAVRPFSDIMPPVYADLRELPSTTLLPLDTLPLSDIDALICQRLRINKLPKPVADLIHSKAEGHPFFSEEIAYALRDTGLITIQDGVCTIAANTADFNTLNFPNTIQGVITSRIDQLTPAQQLTLKVASVIGRVFAYRLLSDIYPSAEQQINILQELNLLEELDLTPKESPEPNLAYLFKHIVTQEVAYSLMTFAQRQQLHQKTAVWYEEMQKNDLTRHFPLLAHHWHQAGNSHKAIDYYSKAGENAYFNYANQEAIRFLTQALTLGSDASPFLKAYWERQIGEAAYRLTFMEQSESHYKAALALMGHPIRPSTPGKIGQIISQLTRQAFHRWLPRHYVGRASSELQKSTLLETARAYEGVSEIYYNMGNFLTSFLCVVTAFNLAEEAGPSPELLRGYANMCATVGAISLHKPAQNYRSRAIDMSDHIDDLPAKAWSRIPLSTYSLQSGAWDRGAAEVNEALEIYTRLGDWRKWCIAAWTLPQISQGKGNLALARSQWAELYDVAVRSQDTRHQVRAQGGKFFNYLSLGLVDEAMICVDVAGIILDENPEMMPLEERLWFGMAAMKALYEENWAAARELSQKQIAAISRASLKFDLQDVFAASAEVLLVLWERDEATAKEAQQALKTLNNFARTNSFARPRATRLQARCAWLSGKEGKAQKLCQKSLALADSLNMPYEKALTLQCLGKFLVDSSYQAEAEALFKICKTTTSHFDENKN